MKIRRIRISSFGPIHNRDYRLSDTMTVFYGPNESGKTSTMEFVRSVLSPKKRLRMPYPARGKNDAGIMDVEDSGKETELTLKGKTLTGQVPECVSTIDETTFRDIFALDAKTLDESDAITKGEIKNRFLTVPGGDRIASVNKWLDDGVPSVVGLNSKSQSELRKVCDEINRCQELIVDLKSRSEQFGEVSEELKELESRKEKLAEEAKADEGKRSLFENYRNNKTNYEELGRLRSKVAAMGDFKEVSDEDVHRRAELLTEADSARKEVERIENAISEAKQGLSGLDERQLSLLSDRIDRLPGDLARYHEDKEEANELRSRPAPIPAASKASSKSRPSVPLVVAGIAMLAVGLVLGIASSPVLFVLAAAGAGLAALAFVKGKAPVQASAPAPADVAYKAKLEECERRMSEFESGLREMCSKTGVCYGRIDDTVAGLVKAKDSYAEVKRYQMPLMSARNKKLEAEGALARFYTDYAGEEGFEQSRNSTAERKRMRIMIDSIEEAIRGSGLDPEKPECPVEWNDSDTKRQMSELGEAIGERREKLRNILNMDDLEAAYDRLVTLQAKKDAILRKGAVLLIAKGLVDCSGTEAYESVQPGVVRNADRYLSIMTKGRYSMNIDPVTNEIDVVSADGMRKKDGEWSSGLRAQILLSIKLAVAMEMGGGKVPVILDDVLLPFDSERKEGALETLSTISKDMQVLIFTCDSETRRLASDIDGVTVQTMRDPTQSL